MNTLTVSKLDQVDVSIPAESTAARDALISQSSTVTEVQNSFDQDCAVDSLRQLSGLAKSVESARVDVKSPVLAIGRKIDSLAKDFCSPVEKEISRLNKLVTAFQVAERERAAELERHRQAELAKIEAERQRIAKEEAKRVADAIAAAERAVEARRASEEAFTKKEEDAARKAEAAALAERQRILQQQADQQAKQAELNRQAAQVKSQPVASAKPAGLVVKEVWKFEVIDIAQLYKSRPELCNVEPKARDIQSAINGGMQSCPGLRIWKQVETGVRQ